MDDADRKARGVTHIGQDAATNWHVHADGKCFSGNTLQETIATALREAEQRGMMRAAEIARSYSGCAPSPVIIAKAIERAAKEA